MELLLLVPLLGIILLVFVVIKINNDLDSDDKEWYAHKESVATRSHEAVEEIERKEKNMKLKGEWLAENPKPKNKWCGCGYVFSEDYFLKPYFRWEDENMYGHESGFDKEKGIKTEYCHSKNKMKKIKYKEVK